MKKRIIPLLALLCLLTACAGKKENSPAPHVIYQPAVQSETFAPVQAEPAETLPFDQIGTSHDDGLEYAICPMDFFSITQTSGEGTHANNYAIDFAGEDGGIETFYAPFTLRIYRIQEGYNIVWAQSTEKVHLASGELDYVSLLLEHCDNIDRLYEGMVIPQGEVFYAEGTAGNATGNHVHAEFAAGPYVDQGSYHAADGRVSINNGVPANDIFFLTSSTRTNEGEQKIGGFTWKYLPVSTSEILAGWHCNNGHTPGEITVTRKPTCTQDGAVQYTCQSCGVTLSEALPALGHTPELVAQVDAPRYVDKVCVYHCESCGGDWIEVEWDKVFDLLFPDVPADDPDYQAICDVVYRKLMPAKPDGTFCPEDFISRAEFITLLYNKCGDKGEFSCTFSDVDEEDEFYPAVAWAFETGLAKATEKNKFTPTCPVTRLDAISMVLQYSARFGLQSKLVSYTDAQSFAVGSGLYEASDNLHCVMTRREAARLLSVMMSLAAVSGF
ncbi:MAG: S-layer homology domain-containing protein [Clostridia bacterium]|nr:S-layer homology domain-containing protein [Clostridia bacterium]